MWVELTVLAIIFYIICPRNNDKALNIKGYKVKYEYNDKVIEIRKELFDRILEGIIKNYENYNKDMIKVKDIYNTNKIDIEKLAYVNTDEKINKIIKGLLKALAYDNLIKEIDYLEYEIIDIKEIKKLLK